MRKYSAPQRRKINYYELIKTEKMSRDRNLYTPTTVKFLSKEQNFLTSYPLKQSDLDLSNIFDNASPMKLAK